MYFIVKWAVTNGIKEAYKDITGNFEDKEENKLIKEFAEEDINTKRGE